MKKFISGLLAVIMCIALTSCISYRNPGVAEAVDVTFDSISGTFNYVAKDALTQLFNEKGTIHIDKSGAYELSVDSFSYSLSNGSAVTEGEITDFLLKGNIHEDTSAHISFNLQAITDTERELDGDTYTIYSKDHYVYDIKAELSRGTATVSGSVFTDQTLDINIPNLKMTSTTTQTGQETIVGKKSGDKVVKDPLTNTWTNDGDADMSLVFSTK